MKLTDRRVTTERRRLMPVAALAAALIAVTDQAVPAAGDLDPTFGTGGMVWLSPGSQDNYASSAIQQSDGRVVVAGWTSGGDLAGTQLLLLRFEENRTLDPRFGRGGIVVGTRPNEAGAALIQQP